jgi:hypothetical protein
LNVDSSLWDSWWGSSERQGGAWRQSEAADLVRELRDHELEAAVAIGDVYHHSKPKLTQFDALSESSLFSMILGTGRVGAPRAHRLPDKLVDLYLLEAAGRGYRACTLLHTVYRSARQSGLFSNIAPPIPGRLSTFLAYDRPIRLFGSGWGAIRYSQPVRTPLDPTQDMISAVHRSDPPRTWTFRFPDDRNPLTVAEQLDFRGELTPEDPWAWTRDVEWAYWDPLEQFELPIFDDLGLLQS